MTNRVDISLQFINDDMLMLTASFGDFAVMVVVTADCFICGWLFCIPRNRLSLWRSPSARCALSVSSSTKEEKNGNGGRLSTLGSADVELSFNVAVTTMVRAQPKDFMAVKKEWAAIRIQSVFCSFLVWSLTSLFVKRKRTPVEDPKTSQVLPEDKSNKVRASVGTDHIKPAVVSKDTGLQPLNIQHIATTGAATESRPTTDQNVHRRAQTDPSVSNALSNEPADQIVAPHAAP
ncbi:hypothetical protein Tco_0520716 [Tanacetum coccineum]